MPNRNANATKEELRDKIESQKVKGGEFRPGTELDPETGHEITRTGRFTDQRDIKPGTEVEESMGEEPRFVSQNAVGGKTNR